MKKALWPCFALLSYSDLIYSAKTNSLHIPNVFKLHVYCINMLQKKDAVTSSHVQNTMNSFILYIVQEYWITLQIFAISKFILYGFEFAFQIVFG